MIRKHNSLVVADNLLNVLMNDEEAPKVDGCVRTFENCREQGYAISIHKAFDKEFDHPYLQVSFAENRNSDQIVVYIGPSEEDTNTDLSKEAYRNARYFSPGDYHAATRYIFSTLAD